VRILALTHSEELGGAESQMIALFLGVAARGHDVALICSAGQYAGIARDAGLAAEPLRGSLGTTMGMVLAARRVRRRCREDGIEIVHAEGMRASLAAGLALGGVDRPVRLICTVHNIRNPRRWSYALAAALLSATGGFLTTVSESERRRYLVHGFPQDRCETVYNGVVLPESSDAGRREVLRVGFGLPATRLLIVQVARLSPEKGHAVLFRALSRLPADAPLHVLVLAGEGPERARLARLRDDLGLGDRVRFLGYRSDVGDLLRCADLLVLPSLREAFPMALLEGMAAGLPVIASRVGGVPEMLDDGVEGWLVDPGDETSLTRSLAHALRDPEARRARGEAGRGRVGRDFSLERMVSRTVDIYRRVAHPAVERLA
jgi:glycosyltransferase involved in cell wall biosynthesis